VHAAASSDEAAPAPVVDIASWQSSPPATPTPTTSPASYFHAARNVLAAIGVIAIVVQLLRAAS
jgi:hypothetical protein